ncbi:MAG: pyridoxal-phosphate dependent enzyme [Phycisphaerae bacterium]|nr:pyridoxal-phosphate dependent enzyme [Phycisphaerae bacterium]
MPLFEAYPRLGERVPWLSIGSWPTPVTDARHFAETQGLKALFIKREDLAHPQCAGNKMRGLEFVLADAKRRGASRIVTVGAAGSHHVKCTAWHARRLGIDTVALVVRQPPAEYVRRNLLIGIDAGVKYVPASYVTLPPKFVVQFLKSGDWRRGRRPFYLAGGGTSSLSCLGHVSAALELKQQIDAGILPEPDYLYVAMGSMGTAAGLAVGCQLAGLKTRLVGVVVAFRWYCTTAWWASLARQTHRLMRRRDPSTPGVVIDTSELSVVPTALGKGYARFTEPSVLLARQMYATEGIELDGTYTAKALHGMMQYINKHGLHDKVHIFWQTYHPPAPMADREDLIRSLPAALYRYFAEATQPLDARMLFAKP